MQVDYPPPSSSMPGFGMNKNPAFDLGCAAARTRCRSVRTRRACDAFCPGDWQFAVWRNLQLSACCNAVTLRPGITSSLRAARWSYCVRRRWWMWTIPMLDVVRSADRTGGAVVAADPIMSSAISPRAHVPRGDLIDQEHDSQQQYEEARKRKQGVYGHPDSDN